ncbi:MAG: hypothetical protein A2V90_07685 [Gammaproteobacteria bacterium RBG_16_57_12]|nr:MAG: hypothetical protein A2V90_07685 [Gammaproteobacteria bacterium RBG_16_57_12]
MADTLSDNIKSGVFERLGSGADAHQGVMDMLVNIPMFSEFDSREIQLLAEYLYAYRAKKGAVLFKEGDRGQYMCLLIDGKAGIYKDNAKGGNKQVAIVRRGKTMGEMAIIDGLPYSATAVTEEPSVIIIITNKNFEQITTQQPRLGVKLLIQISRFISQRLRQTTGVLVDFLESSSG